MTEYIRRKSYSIPIAVRDEGHLVERLSVDPTFDTIHSFRKIGGHILKYYNDETSRIQTVAISSEIVNHLVGHGVAVGERSFITYREHDALVALKARLIRPEDFE